MEAVVYSTFRNHLKDYMKKVNDEFEPLAVVNKNPDEDIVVVSKSEWDSIQETLRIVQNKELSDKVLRGMAQVRAGGIGKPEPLKYDFQGAWSRRIDAENRLIYMVDGKSVAFLSFKDHY